MGINAIALLKIPHLTLATGNPGRVEPLEDGVLLHTASSFADEPEVLSEAIRSMVGDALAQHDDARGIFILPKVAAPSARSYAAVIDEVGEGGMWVPLTDEEQPMAMAGFEAMLGSMMGQLPGGLVASLHQMAAGADANALQQAGKELQTNLQQGAVPAGLANMLGGMGIDVDSPAFAQLLSQVQGQLARDPSALLGLAEQLLGGAQAQSDEEDPEPDGKV